LIIYIHVYRWNTAITGNLKEEEGMTSGECFENKWFYMKDIGKYLSVEILLTCECKFDALK